jgi:hypothetical protein
MEIVEYRRSSNSAAAVGLRRSTSVRSSLRLFGVRWRTSTVFAADNIPCPPSDQETNQQPTVPLLGPSAVPSQTAQEQKKQKSSRKSWLPIFSHQQNKHPKPSSASVGKQKEHKNQKTKQYKTKLASSQLPEHEETIPEYHSSKVSRILGLREGQAQWRKSVSLQLLAEQHNKQFKVSSPRLNAKELRSPQKTHTRQKCGTLSRSPSPADLFLQQDHQFLPMVSSVGTQRRNSMWALGSSKPSMLRFIFIWPIRASTLIPNILLNGLVKHYHYQLTGWLPILCF